MIDAEERSRIRYEDMPNVGSLKATYKERHICLRCAHAAVCHIAKAASEGGDALATLAHCRQFDPRDV